MSAATPAVAVGPSTPRSPALVRYASLADSPSGSFTLKIDADGAGTFVSGTGSGRASTPIQLSQAQLKRLQAQLTASHFARLKHRYDQLPGPIVGGAPDRIRYRGHTVSVAIGATRPAALGTLIATLDGYVTAFYPTAERSPQLVRYGGGFAIADGNFALVMRADGSGSFTRGTTTSEVKLTARQMTHVAAVLRQARFATLRSLYRSKLHLMGPTPDVIAHDGHTVTVQPGARRPARLARVIRALASVVEGFQLPLAGGR